MNTNLDKSYDVGKLLLNKFAGILDYILSENFEYQLFGLEFLKNIYIFKKILVQKVGI